MARINGPSRTAETNDKRLDKEKTDQAGLASETLLVNIFIRLEPRP